MSTNQHNVGKISVVGLGHIGLVTAAGFAELGWEVIGTDISQKTINHILNNKIPFYEDGLTDLVQNNLKRGTLTVTSDSVSAIISSDIIFICVGTPELSDGSSDISQIEAVTSIVAQNGKPGSLLVQKSTAPVSTGLKMQALINETRGKSADIEVAVNPEFLREGTCVRDFFNPDRIVIGVQSDQSSRKLELLYKPLLDGQHSNKQTAPSVPSMLITNINTAELIKQASNAFLATKISFINLIADICDEVEADVSKVSLGMGLDPRIGDSFLNAGLGFGGYCLPKDLKAFTQIGQHLGVDMSLLKATTQINELRPKRILNNLADSLRPLEGKTITVWGLSFKPNTDDLRSSPSIEIVKELLAQNVHVKVHDPMSLTIFRDTYPELGEVDCVENPIKACEGSDALIVATDWPVYGTIDFKYLIGTLSQLIIVDARNMLNQKEIQEMGFKYIGVGK